MKTTMDQPVKVHALSKDEAVALFDKAARRELHMTGDEFLHALDVGKFDKDADRPEIMRVLMLLPLVRS